MALHTYSPLPGFPELRGMRTRLRAPRDNDRERLAGVVADPSRYLLECLEFIRQGDRIDWVVTTRHDDLAIGTCTLHAIDRRTRRAMIGYALHPDSRGRGFATDAVARAMSWAVDAIGIEHFDADVDATNAASQRVLRRLGFTPLDALRWTLQPRASRAATAGSVLPSRNSRKAPPPVEM